jgi:hypothetical protein
MFVKRDKTKKKLVIDHPDTGQLVEWKDLSAKEKEWAVRNYYREYFDEAYNQILFSLLDPDENKEEKELVSIAYTIGRKFLAYLAGFDPDKSKNTSRGNFQSLRDDSPLGNKIH